jgi:hypothetical protein
MRTQLNVVDTSSNAAAKTFTIVYDQIIRYISTFGAQSPQALAKLPFDYAATNAVLIPLLQGGVPGFASVASIGVPQEVTSAPTSSPTGNSSSKSSSFWTLPVIIGIAAGGAVILLILICLLFCLCRPKNSSGSTKPSTSVNSNSRYGSGNGGNGQQYQHQQQFHQPAVTQINAMGSYDDISTMDEPTIPNVITNASGDGYGDQRYV